MIIPDINMLIYAYDDGATQHDNARLWWEELLDGADRVGLPRVVSTGFIRLMSNPRAVSVSLPPLEAAERVRSWFQISHIAPVNPGPNHLEHLSNCLAVIGANASLVPDAHIAALAIENDAEVHSNDSDFERFPGLRWRNPLH